MALFLTVFCGYSKMKAEVMTICVFYIRNNYLFTNIFFYGIRIELKELIGKFLCSDNIY